MPTYTFQDTRTGKTWDELCSWAQCESFLKTHPHVITLITKAPALVGSRYVSGIKNDDGWRENLSRIAEAHPNSALASQHGAKDITSVKKREIVNKWRDRVRSVQ